MPTDSFEVSTVLPATPERIFQAWLDSKEHSAFSRTQCSIEPGVGGKFTIGDGYIQGSNLEIEPNRRIVQEWRTTEFPEESPSSRLELLLVPEEGGTRLRLIHTEIPEGQGASYEKGWADYYFKPMAEYFSGAKAGSEGEQAAPAAGEAAGAEETAPAAATPAAAAPAETGAAASAPPKKVPLKKKAGAGARKAPAKKAVAAKKAPAKKGAAARKAAPAKKAPAKKAPAKKAPAKKGAAARKAAPAKRGAAKKAAPARKGAAKRPAAKAGKAARKPAAKSSAKKPARRAGR